MASLPSIGLENTLRLEGLRRRLEDKKEHLNRRLKELERMHDSCLEELLFNQEYDAILRNSQETQALVNELIGQLEPTTAGTAGRDAVSPASGIVERDRESREGGLEADRGSFTVGHPSVYALNSASGLESVSDENTILLSGEQGFAPSAGGARTPELSWERWVVYIAGKLLFVAVVLSELYQLPSACLDDYTQGDYKGAQETLEGQEPPKRSGMSMQARISNALLIALVNDVTLDIYLSITCLSPQDVISMYNFSTGRYPDIAKVYVYFTGPSCFFNMYLTGGRISQYISFHCACEEQGSVGLDTYLAISGMSMVLLGFMFYGVIFVGLLCWWGSTVNRTNAFYALANKKFHQYIFSTGPFLYVFWMLQTVVWIYRAGGFGLGLSVFLGTCSVVSVLLTVVGVGGRGTHRSSPRS